MRRRDLLKLFGLAPLAALLGWRAPGVTYRTGTMPYEGTGKKAIDKLKVEWLSTPRRSPYWIDRQCNPPIVLTPKSELMQPKRYTRARRVLGTDGVWSFQAQHSDDAEHWEDASSTMVWNDFEHRWPAGTYGKVYPGSML